MAAKKVEAQSIVEDAVAKAKEMGASPEELAQVEAVAQDTADKLERKDPSLMKELTGAFKKAGSSAVFDQTAALAWVDRQVEAAKRSPLVATVLRYVLFLALSVALAWLAYAGVSWLAGGLLWITGSVLLAKVVFVAGVAWLAIRTIWMVYKALTDASYRCFEMNTATTLGALGAAAVTHVCDWFASDDEQLA